MKLSKTKLSRKYTIRQSVSDKRIQKELFGSWTKTLLISNKDMEDIAKIFPSKTLAY